MGNEISLKSGLIIASCQSKSIMRSSTDYCLINGHYTIGEEISINDKDLIHVYPSLMNLFVSIVEDKSFTSDEERMLNNLLEKRN